MARITKRGGAWLAHIRRKSPSGLLVNKSKTFPTKTLAQQWANDLELRIFSGKYGRTADVNVIAVLDKYSEDVTPAKRGAKWEANRLKQIARYPIGQIMLSVINQTHIKAYRDKRMAEVSGSTVARELTLLSHCFSIAVKEWRWLPENPCKGVAHPKENAPRKRIISDYERDILCAQLGTRGVSSQVRLAFEFALETGMRAGEIVGLLRENIIKNTALLPLTKNGKPRTVPLSNRAMAILVELPASGAVFGITSSQLDSMFRKARDAAIAAHAPLAEVTFHDTRHTAATRWAEKLNLLELCSMFGFTPEIAAGVYVNLQAQDIAKKLI